MRVCGCAGVRVCGGAGVRVWCEVEGLLLPAYQTNVRPPCSIFPVKSKPAALTRNRATQRNDRAGKARRQAAVRAARLPHAGTCPKTAKQPTRQGEPMNRDRDSTCFFFLLSLSLTSLSLPVVGRGGSIAAAVVGRGGGIAAGAPLLPASPPFCPSRPPCLLSISFFPFSLPLLFVFSWFSCLGAPALGDDCTAIICQSHDPL